MNKKLLQILIVIFFFVLNVIFYLVDYGSEIDFYYISLITYLTTPILAVFAGFYAVAEYGRKNKHGQALLWVTLGLLGWFFGELIWVIYEFMGKDPFPSVADFFFLAAYPALFVGFIKEHKAIANKNIKYRWFSYMYVLLLVFYLIYGLFYSSFNEAAAFEDFIAATYNYAGILLLVTLFFLISITKEFKGGRLALPWLFIAVGVFFHLAADFLFSLMVDAYDNDFFIYFVIDFLWMGGFLAIAYGLMNLRLEISTVKKKLMSKITK